MEEKQSFVKEMQSKHLITLSLGELTVHDPNTGAFHTYASKYIHSGVEFIS